MRQLLVSWDVRDGNPVENFRRVPTNFPADASEVERMYRKQFQDLEARVRIELTRKGFADLSLTTWVPRRLAEGV